MTATRTQRHVEDSPQQTRHAGAREGSLSIRVELTPDQLDAIAELVAARIAPRSSVDAPTWLDTRGAAEYIAGSTGRVHDLVQLGKLVPRRDGRRLLFRRVDLDAYLEGSA
jgi:hypothetical protein